MSKHTSLDFESSSLLLPAHNALEITRNAAALDFEVSPAVVSCNSSAAPAPPHDESKQAEFLGGDIEMALDGSLHTSAPQNASNADRRPKTDLYSVRNDVEVSSSSSPSVNTIIEADVVMHLSHEGLVHIHRHSSFDARRRDRQELYIC